jgi:O-antigen ligase
MAMLFVVAISPTQQAVEIAPKFYVCLVDPLVWLTALLWGIDWMRSRNLAGLRRPPVIVLAFVALATASVLWAGRKVEALKEVVQLVEYLVVAFMLFASNMGGLKRRRLVRDLFLATGTLVMLIGTIHYLDAGIPAMKVRATFGNRNVFGGYLSLLVPMMFGALLYADSWGRRLWLGAGVLLGLVVTLSGGTYLGVVLALIVLATLRGQRWLIPVMAILLAFSFAVLPVLPRGNDHLLYDTVRLYNDDGDLSTRYMEWHAATEMARAHPLRGVGVGQYQRHVGTHYGAVMPPVESREPDTQNLYLVIASTIGLPGLACFLGIFAFFAGRSVMGFCRAAEPFRKGLALGILGAIVAFMVNSIWSPLLVRGIGVPLAILFSLTAVFSSRED